MFADEAIRDLDRVWDEIFSVTKDITVTSNYVNSLIDTIENKSYYPYSGTQLYYDDAFTGYYFVRFKAYLSFYRLTEFVMFVDRILYAKSDYIKCFKDV